jgi:hypothetical protein
MDEHEGRARMMIETPQWVAITTKAFNLAKADKAQPREREWSP